MTMTIQDIKERIKNTWNEYDFLEYFNITIEDLVDLFEDFIIDNYDGLTKDLEEEDPVFNGSEES